MNNFVRDFVFRVFTLLALFVLTGAAVFAQDDAQAFRTRLADAKSKLASIETILARPDVDDAMLTRLRNDVDPVRIDLVALQSDATGPRDAAKARLDKLGPLPKPEDPPESAEVKNTRKREQTAFGDLDGIIKEAQVQVVRADQLANTITERRRDAFTDQLTRRTASIVDPAFWVTLASDMPRALWSLMLTAYDAGNYFQSRASAASLGLALGIIVAGFFAARFVRWRVMRARRRIAAKEGGSLRLLSAGETALSVVYGAAGWPMVALVPLFAARFADLLPERLLDQVGTGLVVALLVAVIYDAAAEGMLAVRQPGLRLLPLSDWAVKRIRRRTRWIAAILGVYILVQAVGRAIYAPVSLTVAATALASLLFAIVSIALLIRLRSAPGQERDGVPVEDVNRLDILRPIMWVTSLGICASLFLGYVAFAGFLAIFPLVCVFVTAIAYVAMVLIDGALSEGLSGDGRRARTIARAIGVSPRNISLAATLLSGLLRFLVLVFAFMIVTGPFGFYSADMVSVIKRSFFGFQIGGITISPSAILLGLLLLAVVLLVTRLVQGWIRGTLLPRTALDSGLQNSIATIIGYLGVVLAITVGLSEVGLDLQNVAIVAGALSVGIGFGLQSIVSNFVSGLILLAERPIRVGDIVAVGGEEGFVRRISVRATEVETYDRATLIIPNSQLITGTVKNWVYGNTWSRVRITLSVGYDSDVDAVRSAMLAAAGDDPRILPSPPPRVFLAKLGDAALEFELVAVVASVETIQAVRSDLQLRILKAFRAKGLRVVAQLPAAPAPVVVSLEEALGAIEAVRLNAAAGPAEPARAAAKGSEG